jgi:hypothetical protein
MLGFWSFRTIKFLGQFDLSCLFCTTILLTVKMGLGVARETDHINWMITLSMILLRSFWLTKLLIRSKKVIGGALIKFLDDFIDIANNYFIDDFIYFLQ